MLAIRMQRTGRKGHAMFRVIVQDSRRTPTSGKVVSLLGSYDPHAKSVTLDKEKATFYLEHGAQPSDRVAKLMQAEGVALPAWVSLPSAKQRTTRHADKRRSSMPPAPSEEAVVEPAVEAAVVEPIAEANVEPEIEAPAEEASKEVEAPAETKPAEPTEEASKEVEAPAETKPAEPTEEA